jgi:catechol 2,3-dioxygenase-like lactoylglutathione lyase family enzyme
MLHNTCISQAPSRSLVMLDHIGLSVTDFERAKAFYHAALKPLGLGAIMEVTAEETGGDAHAGFGENDKAFFWIGTGAKPRGGTHVAFTAKTRAEVEAFYRAALAAGGRDNGAPGLRPEYHPNYYGAFVFDPDGNNIEAVCHRPEAR